jgi:uncharacterized protein YjbI with pentapeptide repeats
MKRQFLTTVAISAPLLITSSVLAENPAHVQQLQETRACMGCDLSDADLSGEHLIGADLRDANLSGANLTEANLEGADLTGANLENANLTGAFLTNAILTNSNLDHANLTQAMIYDADVTGASMEDLTLTNAEIYNTGIGVGGEKLQNNYSSCRNDRKDWRLENADFRLNKRKPLAFKQG